ncbi:MAG: AAA family ATPase [Solirubrobacteraceae bacterium]|nr:AAA family ATPase [Solirubrobacteraceae bacterium]
MLIERDAPLERLTELASRAASGAGSCVVIEGGAGIGKTALLHHVQQGAAALGLQTLSATGAELEREHAFGVARQLLSPAWRSATKEDRAELLDGAASLALPLLDLTHEHPGAAGAAETQSILYGTHWLLATLAERRPLMLVVDDAHWADEPSITLLEYLARRVAEIPVLLVIGKRPAAPGAASLVLTAETIRLEPLSLGGVVAMADLLSETAETADLATACHQATGGNPLYVYAVLSELRDRGLEQQAEQAVADLGPEPVARSVDRRLSELPPAATAVAEALAILGDDATLLDVAGLAALETSQAAGAADALVRASILARGERLAFAHPVVRATITGRIGDHEQGLRHAQAATQRMKRGRDPERVASHVLRAPAGLVDGAYGVLRTAATAALSRGAPALAATFLRRATDEPCSPQERLDALVALADAQGRAVDPATLQTFAEAQAAASDPDRRAEITISRSLMLYREGEGRLAVDELQRQLRGGELSDQVAIRVKAALLTLADLDLSLRPQLHGQLDELVADLRREGAAPGAVVLAHEAVEERLRYRDSVANGDLSERALRACLQTLEAAPGTQPIHEAMLGLLVLFLDASEHLSALDELVNRALVLAAKNGNAVTYAHLGVTYTWSLIRQGALEDAERLILGVRDQGAPKTVWMRAWVSGLGQAVRAEFEPELGLDPLGHPDELDVGEDEVPPAERALLSVLRGKLLLAKGELEGGLAALLKGGEELGRLGTPAGNYHWRSDAALALGRLGRLDEARSLATEELELNRRWGAPRALGHSYRAAALLAETDEERLEGLLEAVRLLEGVRAPLELARTLVEVGACLRRMNRRADARQPLRRAIELADGCAPHTRVAQRARTELAACGGRAPRSSAGGVEALTASERRIVDLAVQGLSNPQVAQELFISRRTVESHLASAYTKLGIAGRGELGRVLTPAN